jgi:16S rRNA (guanine527-N7)-methyltransferase
VPENVFRYFPSLTLLQKDKLMQLRNIYNNWNNKINVISRKDMGNFLVHHVLHSMAIAKVICFSPGTHILDVGTGGGFPGIPLAILFPDSEFTLLDSIEKKIKVVISVANELDLKNIKTARMRVEENREKYDFVVSRAVADFSGFVGLTAKNITKTEKNRMKNGILCLKGGDLTIELAPFKNKVLVWDIKNFFEEPFFETKRIVYLPV